MTDNKIDLDSIPHPRDCHRVPVGSTIPKGMYVWSQPWSDTASYAPAAVDVVVKSGDVCLTAEPIPAPVPAPTPEDSPIIASGVYNGGVRFTDHLLVIDPDDELWQLTGHDGWVTTDNITEWSPAIVTATGHGVMDDRDKRDRMLSHGDRVGWIDSMEVWGFPGGGECYGTLAAIAADWDEDLRFADEVQS